MTKALISLLLLSLSTTTTANSAIRINGELYGPGDNINGIYHGWGDPNFNVKSQRTCNRVIIKKRDYCSRSRKVWKKGDIYWMVQHSGSMIIKIDWTRFKSDITEKM